MTENKLKNKQINQEPMKVKHLYYNSIPFIYVYLAIDFQFG